MNVTGWVTLLTDVSVVMIMNDQDYNTSSGFAMNLTLWANYLRDLSVMMIMNEREDEYETWSKTNGWNHLTLWYWSSNFAQLNRNLLTSSSSLRCPCKLLILLTLCTSSCYVPCIHSFCTFILHTSGSKLRKRRRNVRASWTGDEPVATPLPNTDINALSEIEPTISVFELEKTFFYLRSCVHCDLHYTNYWSVIQR
jgi:hypothetical protein